MLSELFTVGEKMGKNKFTCARCQAVFPNSQCYRGVHWGFMGEYDPTYMGMCYSCAKKSVPKGQKVTKFGVGYEGDNDFLNLFPKSARKKR